MKEKLEQMNKIDEKIKKVKTKSSVINGLVKNLNRISETPELVKYNKFIKILNNSIMNLKFKYRVKIITWSFK